MKERGILMSAPMVRAILEGRKTQTRRVVKPQPPPTGFINDAPNGRFILANWTKCHREMNNFGRVQDLKCPYGLVGDRLWVRETWGPCDGGFCYRASEHPNAKPDDGRWHPGIHMFREASRIDLEITGVRVERLQEISGEDAQAEGWPRAQELYPNVNTNSKARDWYERLWCEINGKGSWQSNPFVWVITFKRL